MAKTMKEDQTNQAGWKFVEAAKACLLSNDFSGAIDRLGQAVREFRLCAASNAECYTLHMLALVHNEIGNFDQAARVHERGLAIAKTLSKAYVLTVDHLDGLGVAQSNMGKWQQAVEYFEQALEETRKPIVGLRQRHARVLQHLANVYTRYTNRYAEAIRLYDEAIAISKDCRDNYNIAVCLSFKGQAVQASGNTEKSLDLFEQAKEIAEAEGHEPLLAACYAHLAAAYFNLNQNPLARQFCEQALKLDRKFGNKQGLSRDLFLLARLHAIENDEESALELYRESFLLARSIKDVKNTLQALDSLALIYQRRLQAHKARNYFEEALALCREIGDKRSEIEITVSLASLGDEPRIFETLERSLAAAREEGFSHLELDIETALARSYDLRADYLTAKMHYERSVTLLEDMRLSFRIEEHLRAFSESNAEIYDRLVDLCLLLGHKIEAFKYSELARARVLNNLRRARKKQPAGKLQGPQLERYRKVCDEIIHLDLDIQRLQLHGLPVPEMITESLRRALIQETEIVLSVKRAASETYAVDNFGVVDVAELQAQLSDWEQNVIVLAYYTADNNSHVFIINKDNFDVVSLGMKSSELREVVQAFRAGLGIKENLTRDLVPFDAEQRQPNVNSTLDSYLLPSRRLYDVLINPIRGETLAADHLCIIPHGPLHFMPFHALHDGKQFLIEQAPISYAPSTTTLSECLAQQFTPIRKVLALGDPLSELRPLQFARREVEAIEELLGSQRCLQQSGNGATRDLIVTAGRNAADTNAFDCWHLAMHGVFVRAAPHLSYLQLASEESEGGRVFAFEIASMDRVGRLCVLSACQTALTREARGDELSGLLFSFMAAGAQAVVASLWSVEDESTGALMHAFYNSLINTEQFSLATALQRASLALLNAPATASPYYWAPFVLHGNWNPHTQAAAKQTAKLLSKPPEILVESLSRARILFHEGESYLVQAKMAREKHPLSFLPDEQRVALNRAIEAFSQAVELAPDWPLVYRQRGTAYRALFKAEEAAADFKRTVDLNPQDAVALACLGLVAENREERTLALQSLERAFLLDPKIQLRYPEVNTARLHETLKRLRAERTIEETTPPLGSSPNDAAGFLKRGFAYWQLMHTSGDYEGNKKKAIEDFKRALELDSKCALAAVRLAWMDYSNYKPGAIEAYSRIVDIDPRCAEAHLRLAQACNHQVERAIDEYRAALACDPSIEHGYCGLGEAYLEQAQWQLALDAFETERIINPNCFQAHLYLKEFYRAVDRYEEANTEYQECFRTTEHDLYEGKLGVDLKDEVVQWIRKLARQQQSRPPQASRPMKLRMTELQRYLNTGNDLTKAGQIQEAIVVYGELIEKDPGYALAYAYRGGCYGAVKEHEKAFADLRKALELEPECAEAYFNLYVTCSNRGELDKAQQYLDRAIVLDPELAKRVREKGNEEQRQKDLSSLSISNLTRDLEESYRSSGLKCRWCEKPLRMPLGRLIVTSGADEIEEILKGVPYCCVSCRATSCFECCADSRLQEVLCRSCGGQMKPWELVGG